MLMPLASGSGSARAYQAGGAALLVAIAVILTALAFEHLGGYLPCPLCLQQRYAYYGGIPLLLLALVLLRAGRTVPAAALFAVVAAAFVANAAVGLYHAGAEWKLWAGPDTCESALRPLATDDIGRMRVIRCDEAPWRLLGLSFAGWNVVLSLALAAAAAAAARAAWRG